MSQSTLTEEDYLLACLAEECGEIQQVVGKIMRFGLDDLPPDGNKTNRELLQSEFIDLCSVYMMLVRAGVLPFPAEAEDEAVERKTERVKKYMEYSRKVGRLEPYEVQPTADSRAAPEAH